MTTREGNTNLKRRKNDQSRLLLSTFGLAVFTIVSSRGLHLVSDGLTTTPPCLCIDSVPHAVKSTDRPRIASTATASPSMDTSWFSDTRVRVVVSFFLIGHLWAVIGRPLEFATQGPFGASPSASAWYAPVRAYSQFAYLDHGYAFFAPDPGPSHFFEAAITNSFGEIVERKFPDLTVQWPRLLYHRHFMLAEFLNDVHQPPIQPPPEIAGNPVELERFMRGRRRFESVRDSILKHLRYHHPESKVAIRRVEHRQPGLPEFFGDNVSVADQRLLRVLFDTIDGLRVPTSDPAPTTEPLETPEPLETSNAEAVLPSESTP